jgi:hypothetical protein
MVVFSCILYLVGALLTGKFWWYLEPQVVVSGQKNTQKSQRQEGG